MNVQSGNEMRLRDVVLVARRELAVRLRSTAFRVSMIILLVGTVAGIAIPAALLGKPQSFTVAVTADAPAGVAQAVRADSRAAGLQVRTVPVTVRRDAVRRVDQGTVSAAVAGHGEIIWKTSPSTTLDPVLTAAVQKAIVVQRASQLGLSVAETARLLAPIRVVHTQLHGNGQRPSRLIIAEVGVILLYMAISFYGGYVLTGVVEEKASRVVEVLLSRMEPASLLGGKIAGIGLAGLIQFLAVAATAIATLLITKPTGLPAGALTAIPMLVVWFVLGYALYSMLYGSLGSLASRTEDAQAAAAPVIAMLVGIYVAAMVAAVNPGAGWVAVVSVLPPTAPIFMPLRTSLMNVPPWQVAVAMLLMVVTIYGLFRLGGRLYRNAVLHSGPRLRLREAWHSQELRSNLAHQ